MSMVNEVGELPARSGESSVRRVVATSIAALGALIGGGGVILGEENWWAPYALAVLLLVPSLRVLRRTRPPNGSRRQSVALLSFRVFMGLVGWWLNPRHPAGLFYVFYGAFVATGVALIHEFRDQVVSSPGLRAGAVVVAAFGALIAGGGMMQGDVDWWTPYFLASLLLVPSLVVLYLSRPPTAGRRYAVAIAVCLGFMGLVGWLSDPLRPAASFYILFWPLVCIGMVLAWRTLLAAIAG